MAENCKRDDQTRIACAKFGHFFVVKYSRDVTGEPRDKNGQWTDSGGSAIGTLAKTATERGWSVKVMAKKAIEAGIDPVKLRNAAAEIVKSGKAKRPNFRSDNGRGKVIDDGSGLSDDEINENFSSADDLLKKHGGVMDDESDSGSRYYSIPNGGKVRVADHEPNEATSQWIERNDVHQIRTDKRTFKSALQQVIEEMRGSVKYSRDVSGEARDKNGQWTDSGGGSGEKKAAMKKIAVMQVTIPVDSVISQISDIDVPPLDPVDCKKKPIVYLNGNFVEIIDGYHRIAGMVKFGAKEIKCLTTDDLDLLGDAADPEDTVKQADALSKIYAAV